MFNSFGCPPGEITNGNEHESCQKVWFDEIEEITIS
jgi:hypothetical protein